MGRFHSICVVLYVIMMAKIVRIKTLGFALNDACEEYQLQKIVLYQPFS